MTKYRHLTDFQIVFVLLKTASLDVFVEPARLKVLWWEAF